MKLICTIAIVFTFLFTTEAQSYNRCDFDAIRDAQIQSDPALAQSIAKAYEDAAIAAAQIRQEGSRMVYTVPTVVHVIHSGQAVGTGANISDAQIQSQMDVLNEDFRLLNADNTTVPVWFNSDKADAEIEFCLATIDPNGNPTTGIDRVNPGSYNNFDTQVKPVTVWNRNNYLNIWVTDLGGALLGYATPPGGNANQDGVVVHYEFFGRSPANPFVSNFDRGRTATHEVGHWLGLAHTFQGNCSGTTSANCSTQGDGLCDTPPTNGANYGCPSTTQNTCTETPTDQNDMWMNYMDYVNDACMVMFSNDQVAVMRGVLNSSRSSILTSTACQSGNTFTYSGKVIDGTSGVGIPNAQVLFQDGGFKYETTTTATGDFSFSNFIAGTYDVYAGKWGYNTNNFATGQAIGTGSSPLSIPIDFGVYYDDFILNLGWTQSSDASVTSGIWVKGVPVATTFNGSFSNPGFDINSDFGNECAITGNAGGAAGDDDIDGGGVYLVSPEFNLVGMTNPYVHFYSWFFNDGGQSTPDDEMVISIEDGTNFKDALILDANSSGNGSWVKRSLRVKGGGVNLTANMNFVVSVVDQGAGHLVEGALDVFTIRDSTAEATSIVQRDPEISMFDLYPNPATTNIQLIFDSEVNEDYILSIYDFTGSMVRSQKVNERAMNFIDISELSNGVYVAELSSATTRSTSKFIKQ